MGRTCGHPRRHRRILRSDPASVAFRAYEQARAENIDILLKSTLPDACQNKSNLMAESAENPAKVLKKIDESAPHHVILVLDATTGQNLPVKPGAIPSKRWYR